MSDEDAHCTEADGDAQRGSLQPLALVWDFIPAALAVALAVGALFPPAPSWALEYYPNSELEGPAHPRDVHVADFDTRFNSVAPGLPERDGFSLRLRTCLQPPAAGLFKFRLSADGGARLLVNSVPLIEMWGPTPGNSAEKIIELGTAPHSLTIEYHNDDGPASLEAEMAFPAHFGLHAIDTIKHPGPNGECT